MLVVGVCLGSWFRVVRVSSDSMLDTLHNKDLVMTDRSGWILNRTGGYWMSPRRGQIVVFRWLDGSLMIKRVVAVQGDRIQILHGITFINGVPTPEKYVRHVRTYVAANDWWPTDAKRGSESIIVSVNHYFVMGDNRDVSTDSRHFGAIPGNSIVGIARVVFPRCQQVDTR